MNFSPQRVAVVGAGIAGLACTAALLDKGHQVDLFEKSRGPAGRMSTRRGHAEASDPDAQGSAAAWQCDHGAQYFTARDPAFRVQVDRWLAAGVASLWPARLASVEGGAWTRSSSAVERFVGTPRMTSPAAWVLQQLGEQVCFHAQSTIHQLEHSAGKWGLHSKEQGWLPWRYDALVLAIPAPQAATLLSEPAPAAAHQARSVRMRGSWALMLRFDAPVNLPCDGAFINSGPLRWMARDSSKPGRTGPETWLLHARAEWSEAHIEDEPEAVAAALLAAFRDLGGPAPGAATVHRWRYADTDPESPQTAEGHWWDAEMRLGLCGDWLNGGKVEGAWLSGHALASAFSA